VIVAQCLPQIEENLMLVASQIIEIPEKSGVWRDANLALTQHAKAIEHCKSVQVQVDQLAPQVIQNRYKELARRKTESTHQV
jgi:hypothetical protein